MNIPVISLEELDQGAFPLRLGLSTNKTDYIHLTVFSVPTHVHASYQLKALPHNIKKYIFRMKLDEFPPLYQHEGAIGDMRYSPGETSKA